MKATVSSKLRGTILLPTIRPTSFKAKDTFSLSDEQFYASDVQKAVSKGDIKIAGKSPKPTKFIKVSNVGASSLILPEVGVLRSGKTIDIPVHLIKHHEVIRLISAKLLKKGELPLELQKDEVETVSKKKSGADEKMSAVAYRPKGVEIRPTPTDLRDTPPPQRKQADAKGNGKKKKGIVKKHTTGDDLLLDIDNGTTPGDHDGITFVDVAGSGLEDGAVDFVDNEQTQARIRNHPHLGKE